MARHRAAAEMESRGHGRGSQQPAGLVFPVLNTDPEKIPSAFLRQAERVGSVYPEEEKAPGRP